MKKSTTPLLLLALAMSAFALLRPLPSPAYANTMMADSSIAVCALPSLINDLMGSDRFSPQRLAYQEELNAELQELNERGRELGQRLSNMTPEDPGAQDAFAQFQRLREQVSRLQAENSRKMEIYTAKQVKECNALVRSSTRAVAEDLGFDFVISSADEEEELAESVEVLFRQIT